MEAILTLTNLLLLLFIVVSLFIGKAWVKNTVQYAVKHDYDVLLTNMQEAYSRANEEQKRQHEIRMKSALIAELMAEWMSNPQDMKKLRQLTNEAFLWLPADLASELSLVLSHNENAIDTREFFSRVRKHLLGSDDNLEPHKFITYDLSAYEISQIARLNIEAHTLVNFPENSYKGKPFNLGSADHKE
jgi:hypothetical protein